jgi:hypothetical protein
MNAASLPIVLGYNIGNEGLSERRDRYSLADLCSTITSLRAGTGKPVATSEDIDTYYRRPELLQAGDWVFAIAHPYWHWTKYPLDAVRWELDQYAALQKRTDRFIFFKEVGLPSGGASGLSEASQDLFYRGLSQTDVQFAYFEGFDQPTKAYTSVEPHWGIFNANLSPKLLTWNMMGYRLFTSDDSSQSWLLDCPQSAKGCSARVGEGTLLVGQGLDKKQYRVMLSFNTANLPDGADITAVKLKIKSMGFVGVDPLANHQTVMVDICTPPVRTRFQRQGSAAIRPWTTCITNVGTLNKASHGGWYIVDISASAFQSINLMGATQFRLRLAGQPGKDAPRSYILFHGGTEADADNPILLVRYNATN